MKKKAIALTIGLITIVSIRINSQINVPKIDWIPYPPMIDGVLDDNLKSLPVRTISYFSSYNIASKKTSLLNYHPQVSYRTGYNIHFFYLYVEGDFDSVYYHPENSWFGDRLQVVFAQPNKDSITNYFYGLCFDAGKNSNKQLYRISNCYEQLWNCSNKTKFTSCNSDNKVGYEAIIDWNDIKPYHPLFMSPIGFNLIFSKALNDSIIVEYCAKYSDHLIGGNGMSARYFIPDFKKPGKFKESYYGYSCYSKYVVDNSIIIDMISSFSNKTNDTLKINIRNDKDSLVFTTAVYIDLPKNFTQDKIEIHPDLKKGNYTIEIISILKPILTNNTFTIIPQIDFKTIDKLINANSFHLPAGTVKSLYFQYMELKKEVNNPAMYAPRENLNRDIENFYSNYDQFIKGIDS